MWTLTVLQKIRRTIARHELCPPKSRVLVALSGGSDSVALLWLLRDLATAGELTLAGAAHLNHQLRVSAGRDEEFCRSLGDKAGVRIVLGSADVAAEAARARLSLEDAARRARYAFLAAAAEQVDATCIATGHTLDDQAETLLLKLLRGAGATGLGGIHPRRGNVIRPLLDTTRQELQRELESRGESWVEDETNTDLRNPRNRLRHDVLPRIEEVFGPSARHAIARAAAVARADAQWLDVLAGERYVDLVERTGESVQIDRDGLCALPAPLAQRVLLRSMREGSEGREIGFEHVEAALDVLSRRCTAAEVPGGRWELSGTKLVLVQRRIGGRGPAETLSPFRYELAVPGTVTVREADCQISAEWTGCQSNGQALPVESADAAVIAAAGGLVIRSRRPGDRLRIAGMGGSKKLQDVFVDAKLARADRDRTPVVTTADDRVVWVPGHAISADFGVSGPEHPMILLKFTRLGGKA